VIDDPARAASAFAHGQMLVRAAGRQHGIVKAGPTRSGPFGQRFRVPCTTSGYFAELQLAGRASRRRHLHGTGATRLTEFLSGLMPQCTACFSGTPRRAARAFFQGETRRRREEAAEHASGGALTRSRSRKRYRRRDVRGHAGRAAGVPRDGAEGRARSSDLGKGTLVGGGYIDDGGDRNRRRGANTAARPPGTTAGGMRGRIRRLHAVLRATGANCTRTRTWEPDGTAAAEHPAARRRQRARWPRPVLRSARRSTSARRRAGRARDVRACSFVVGSTAAAANLGGRRFPPGRARRRGHSPAKTAGRGGRAKARDRAAHRGTDAQAPQVLTRASTKRSSCRSVIGDAGTASTRLVGSPRCCHCRGRPTRQLSGPLAVGHVPAPSRDLTRAARGPERLGRTRGGDTGGRSSGFGERGFGATESADQRSAETGARMTMLGSSAEPRRARFAIFFAGKRAVSARGARADAGGDFSRVAAAAAPRRWTT